jgi:hypothetical protein
MTCFGNAPFVRVLGTRAARQPARGLAVLALTTSLVGACTGTLGSPGDGATGSGGSSGSASGGSSGSASGGSSGSASGGSSGSASGGSSGSASGGSSGSASGGSSGSGGSGPVVLNKGGTTLRLLTRDEYLTSMQALLGTLTTQLVPPTDNSVAGFVSVGAGQLNVTDAAGTAYEAASLAATAEVFGDSARWQKLVGCNPKADLSDACVTTFLKSFGRSAFRRDLTNDEVTQWLGVAKNAATVSGTAAQGLASMTSGLLQSPNFLYRVETNKLDSSNGRLKYDGLSMATRLSYALTGGPPSSALLTAATSGQLDTADGVRTAASPLLSSSSFTDRMTAFFSEYAQASQVTVISKSAELASAFTPAVKSSMLQGLQLFLKNVVLGSNADVRSFYDSDQVFADANLASFYGVQAPASGFAQFKVPASSGRGGILGQAGLIAAQSQVDRTSPTRRGIFILESLLCITPPTPPAGVNTNLPVDKTLTTREILEAHRKDPTCANCHALFDPLGMAMEHFDPIGRYRDQENGKPIDATGTVGGKSFDGVAQLGGVLRQDPRALACLLSNFYRNANGRAEDDKDRDQIDAMGKSLASRNYVWSNFLADFVASDAFRSAPALPVTTGSP